jgi:hypothetical protein
VAADNLRSLHILAAVNPAATLTADPRIKVE